MRGERAVLLSKLHQRRWEKFVMTMSAISFFLARFRRQPKSNQLGSENVYIEPEIEIVLMKRRPGIGSPSDHSRANDWIKGCSMTGYGTL